MGDGGRCCIYRLRDSQSSLTGKGVWRAHPDVFLCPLTSRNTQHRVRWDECWDPELSETRSGFNINRLTFPDGGERVRLMLLLLTIASSEIRDQRPAYKLSAMPSGPRQTGQCVREGPRYRWYWNPGTESFIPL